ncbi:MAG: glycosyltransferase [Candidatus Dormibacteraeota bacterium]|nr:glycosyltransferase [Candidatus Dormibacteraeota bacterium]
MRVLFSSTWGLGHVFPMLPLARAFAAAGHQVLWATSADSCTRVVAAGVDANPAGLSGTALREVVRDLNKAAAAQVSPPEQAQFTFPRMFGEAFTPAMVADLLPLAQRWRPDILVHENGELASPLVGAILGAPSITHAFGGAIPASFLDAAGRRLEPLWSQYGQAVPPYAGCFTRLYLDICPAAVQTVGTSHITAIQPLRPEQYIGEPPSVLPPFLSVDGRPLVYLTLGTMFNHPGVLRPAIQALSALRVRLLVALGPTGNPTELDPGLPNVRVETWVHQPQVLEHSQVVVSHAGSGTFLGALGGGLPQLCIPQAADQFRNADGGVRSGAALLLTPEQATPETIADAVATLLEEDNFRHSANGIAADIRAMPSPAEVVEKLSHVN